MKPGWIVLLVLIGLVFLLLLVVTLLSWHERKQRKVRQQKNPVASQLESQWTDEELLYKLQRAFSKASKQKGTTTEMQVQANPTRGIVVVMNTEEDMELTARLLERLRLLGCTLSVEVYCTDKNMLLKTTPKLTTQHILTSSTVLVLDALEESTLDEILVLHPSIVPTQDPEFLFSSTAFHDYGTLFWPDVQTFDRVEQKDVLAFQALSKKVSLPSMFVTQDASILLFQMKRCARALQLCRDLKTTFSSYFSRLCPRKFDFVGEDTWQLSWLVTQTPYHMFVPTPLGQLGFTHKEELAFTPTSLVHHDKEGNILFVHPYEHDATWNAYWVLDPHTWIPDETRITKEQILEERALTDAVRAIKF